MYGDAAVIDDFVAREGLGKHMDVISLIRQRRRHSAKIIGKTSAIGFFGGEFGSHKRDTQNWGSDRQMTEAAGEKLTLELKTARLTVIRLFDDADVLAELSGARCFDDDRSDFQHATKMVEPHIVVDVI